MDPQKLKEAVEVNLYKYIKDKEQKDVEIDGEIKKEFESQRKYLEASKKTLEKEYEMKKLAHKNDNQNIMLQNMDLLQQIVSLRSEIKELNKAFTTAGGSKAMEAKKQEMAQQDGDVPDQDNKGPGKSQTQEEEVTHLEEIEGYENSIDNNIEARKNLIADYRHRNAQLA